MKNAIYGLGFLIAAPFSIFAGINTYNVFTDADGVLQFYQSGGAKFTDAFTFEVGVLGGADYSVAGIANNFISLGFSSTWDPDLLDDGVGGASVSMDFNGSYPNGLASGQQIAIWAYNSKEVGETSEWVVISNPGWLLTELATGPSVVATDYTITDTGTLYLFGRIEGNNIVAAVASPVPEPLAFAAALGLLVLGYGAAVCRKR